MSLSNSNHLPLAPAAVPIQDTGSQHCLAGIKIYTEAREEYNLIKKAHHTLAPTGCTPEFCQAGRMARIHEPRVGRDRPLAEIQQEAIGFLRECRDEDIIDSDQLLERRIKQALVQIMTTSEEKIVTDQGGNQFRGIAGGTWEQTYEELEYGLRAAWRNSRRCIMRSEHMHLALYDLRHVTTSREMVHTILDGMVKAFNGGRIIPACFVFPPRLPGRRGPMVWNNQILQFAGYRQSDGSVLGDPASVELTEAFIEFGWKPPRKLTRWDILPLIAMAEGDRPYMAEIPLELRRTVSISHPRFEAEFKEMDLHWVMAPALSRLGFDIGGNQYTSSPFIGWFMDAEIGVRNLADSFRYNVLPELAQLCNLSDEPDTPFENLPEYLTLVALSRAQAELNFAVYYSFLRAHVMMTDTMTGSIKYQNYDLDRQDVLGYRLPADPYWLAPPQGSIVPLWHQGGLPNYQPKPMICRHVQDPIKAWKRELEQQRRGDTTLPMQGLKGTVDERGRAPTIGIYLCSSGVNAAKMARKLYNTLQQTIADIHNTFKLQPEKALNTLSLRNSSSEDIILIVASTTGSGDIPSNAAKFVKEFCSAKPLEKGPRFSVFANGDSTYGDTYNAAARMIQETMTSMGCRPLLGQSFAGDTALKNPDWESFNLWMDTIDHLFMGNLPKIDFQTSLGNFRDKTTVSSDMPFATLVNKYRPHHKGMVQVTFDIGDLEYHEMDHLKLLAPNSQDKVRLALKSFGLQEDTQFTWHSENAFGFLCHFVDLSRPFKTLRWYPAFNDLSEEAKMQLRGSTASDILDQIKISWTDNMIEDACKDMGSIQPRLYSIASSQKQSNNILNGIQEHELNNHLAEVIVKINDMGRFSNTWLLQAPLGAKIRFGLASPDTWRLVRAQRPDAPLIAITTGSGMGPVRSVLQSRIRDLKWTSGLGESLWPDEEGRIVSNKSCSRKSSVVSNMSVRVTPKLVNHLAHLGISNTSGTIHLFVGFKNEDELLIEHLIRPAVDAGVFGTLEMVPSNPDKVRIQDRLNANREKLSELFEDPDCIVFVCANSDAAEEAERRLDEIAGSSVRKMLGERYIEEVFRSHNGGSG